jgi:hypothetical protein
VAGGVERLTVKVLKDELTSWVVGGRPWKAGSKTRAMLVSDYVAMMKEEGKGEGQGFQVWFIVQVPLNGGL